MKVDKSILKSFKQITLQHQIKKVQISSISPSCPKTAQTQTGDSLSTPPPVLTNAVEANLDQSLRSTRKGCKSLPKLGANEGRSKGCIRRTVQSGRDESELQQCKSGIKSIKFDQNGPSVHQYQLSARKIKDDKNNGVGKPVERDCCTIY